MTPRLIVFAKAPVIGGAKSRLARGIGKVPAWRIYRSMLARLTRRLRDRRWEIVLAVTPDRAVTRRFPGAWPDDLPRMAQGGGDLGDRQARVFGRRLTPPRPSPGGEGGMLRRGARHQPTPGIRSAPRRQAVTNASTSSAMLGKTSDGVASALPPTRGRERVEGGSPQFPPGPVMRGARRGQAATNAARPGKTSDGVASALPPPRGRVGVGGAPTCVIGADAPQITRADIAAAFMGLKRHDAVIGPAEDGGYWLLALNAPAPAELFEGMRWSHAETRADLETRLRACGLTRIQHLRTLRDVDEAGDLTTNRQR